MCYKKLQIISVTCIGTCQNNEDCKQFTHRLTAKSNQTTMFLFPVTLFYYLLKPTLDVPQLERLFLSSRGKEAEINLPRFSLQVDYIYANVNLLI